MGHWKGQYPWPFGRDPNSLVLRRDVESDRLIGNVSVTYVTLVPWRRERRRHVPSPRLLYHRWAAGPRLGSSAKTWICAAPAAYLCSRCDQRQLDAIIACQCALARLVYTRSGLVSLSDIPIRRSSDVTSPFPPSGNEGYIRNRDVSLTVAFSSSAFFGLLFLIFLLTMPHRFSMFRSGEFADQSSTPTPRSFNQLLVLLAVWAGAKSCWKMKSASLKSCSAEGSMKCSNISW